jgi:hypothetical protein
MEQFVDVPKKEIMDSILPELKKQIESASKATGIPLEVDRLEWTTEGMRIWMQPLT